MNFGRAVKNKFVKSYNDFRRSLFPPSINEFAWRMDSLAMQLAMHLDVVASLERHAFVDELARDKMFRQGEKSLARWNAQMFSQNFEDSIIADIVARLGDGPRRFVEIGTESGEECNSRLLLALGWRGLWIEADDGHAARARELFSEEIASGRLEIECAFVSKENIQGIIEAHGFHTDLEFLSIDVDQNTSHIWRGITTQPRFACIEYNANLPPIVDFEVPYDSEATWKGDAWYGASLKRLELIGREKGMNLVGCDLFGINSFFVRADLVGDKFVGPFDAETHWEPMRLPCVGRRGHKRPTKRPGQRNA